MRSEESPCSGHCVPMRQMEPHDWCIGRRLAVLGPRLHQVHLQDVVVSVGILHQHDHVVGVGPMLQGRVQARGTLHTLLCSLGCHIRINSN
jgi:hypothetical protein